MKKTQYEETAQEGVDPFVYYGAFAKMKDAAGAAYGEETAMVTVDWDKEIDGFNGFMYAMYSQIVKNAEHPYTACLYARFLLTPESYEAMCYNSSTPNSLGEPPICTAITIHALRRRRYQRQRLSKKNGLKSQLTKFQLPEHRQRRPHQRNPRPRSSKQSFLIIVNDNLAVL